MKKIILLIINLILLVLIVFGMIVLFKDKVGNADVFVNNSNLKIVTTLFPEYDFAKQIVGDKANVSLIMKSGVETHNFEPTAKDIIEINSSDLFITLGEELEPWVKDISASIENKEKIFNVTNNIELISQDFFEEKHEEEHDHEHEESHDSHVWLSPKNAKIMIDNILGRIIEIDPENKEFYIDNAEKYKNEIDILDKQLREEIFNNKNIVLAVGGEFAYSYFVKEYDVNFVSVYTNCGHGEDPSIARVKSVIDIINDKKIPVVFYEELSEGLVAKMIAEETNAEAKVLYTIHNGNISGEEKDTYVSLMKKNIENIKLLVNDK